MIKLIARVLLLLIALPITAVWVVCVGTPFMASVMVFLAASGFIVGRNLFSQIDPPTSVYIYPWVLFSKLRDRLL